MCLYCAFLRIFTTHVANSALKKALKQQQKEEERRLKEEEKKKKVNPLMEFSATHLRL